MAEMRVDRASLLVPATAERCFDAWTRAGRVAAWLPPGDATMAVKALDASEGGRFRFVLSFPEAAGCGKTGANTDVVNGRFVTLDRPRYLEVAIVFESADPAYAGTMRMQWSFEAEAGGTRVSVDCHDVPEGIDAGVHEAALDASLAQLAGFLEQDPGGTR